MEFLRDLAKHRKVQLLVGLALLAVVVSRFVLSSEAALTTVVRSGYWVLLGVVAYFGYLLSRLAREWWTGRRFCRADASLLAVVLLTGAVLLAHERYGYKILADEVLLSGTSMGLHYERRAAYPLRATDIQGPLQLLDWAIDKRPFFFPFLVSLVHDLTGYRPENAFYLNTALGFVFLGLIAVLGTRLGGTRLAGALTVLLFAGLPLLSQQMKGGGFELLNVLMLTTVLALSIRFADRPDETSLAALACSAVLLAFTRYESILVLVPVAALVGTVWWRHGRICLNWPTVFLPVTLLLPLLQNRVFAMSVDQWQLEGVPGATTPFGLQYLPGNLGHALGFFFDFTGYQPNSPLLAGVGLVALAFFLLWIVRVLLRPRTSDAGALSTAWWGVALFLLAALLMVYFWGQIDHPVIHRLSLPLHLLMVVAVVVVGRALVLRRPVWIGAVAVAGAFLLLYAVPVMSRRAYGATYSPSVVMEWRTEFLRRFPERDYLFIDNDSVFWIAHRLPATPNTKARERLEGITYHLRNNSFSAIYVLQHFRVDPETGKWNLEPSDDIGPEYELEPFWERRIQTLFIARISRVKAIRQDGQVVAEHRPVVRPPAENRTQEQWDAAKRAYVDTWLKRLP